MGNYFSLFYRNSEVAPAKDNTSKVLKRKKSIRETFMDLRHTQDLKDTEYEWVKLGWDESNQTKKDWSFKLSTGETLPVVQLKYVKNYFRESKDLPIFIAEDDDLIETDLNRYIKNFAKYDTNIKLDRNLSKYDEEVVIVRHSFAILPEKQTTGKLIKTSHRLDPFDNKNLLVVVNQEGLSNVVEKDRRHVFPINNRDTDVNSLNHRLFDVDLPYMITYSIPIISHKNLLKRDKSRFIIAHIVFFINELNIKKMDEVTQKFL